MLIVQLDAIEVYAPVGVYQQEALLKNALKIDIALAFAPASITDLPFIDYGLIYEGAVAVCAQPTPLLEDLLQGIYKNIKGTYPNVAINISIAKKLPPLGGTVASATVAWKEF